MTGTLILASFNWEVAGIVVGVVAIVLAVAIVAPGIAIVGTSWVGTACAIAAVALVCGALAGHFAGDPPGNSTHKPGGGSDSGRSADHPANSPHRHLDISFELQSGGARRAVPFHCILVWESGGAGSQSPPERIIAANGTEFYAALRAKLEQMLLNYAGDPTDAQIVVQIFMDPSPGDGVYERVNELVHQASHGRCQVKQINGPPPTEADPKKSPS